MSKTSKFSIGDKVIPMKMSMADDEYCTVDRIINRVSFDRKTYSEEFLYDIVTCSSLIHIDGIPEEDLKLYE